MNSKSIVLFVFAFSVSRSFSQPVNNEYPQPEFRNEVYFLRHESSVSVERLEKGNSRIESQTKLGGLGGSESSYRLNGSHAPIRLSGVEQLSFVYTSGSGTTGGFSAALRDSIMKANGVDPATMPTSSSMNDPVTILTLYKAETSGDKRKVLMQKNAGAVPFASKKAKASDKCTFSVKKISPTYWVLVLDKPLPKGEYIFTMMNMMSVDGEATLFAFGVD